MNLVKQIKEVFEKEPSNLDEIKKLLSLRHFTKNELAELAISFTDDCFGEYYDALDPEIESVTIENMHSNHVFNAIKMLLEFGLDPNTILDNDNVLWNAMWIDAPNVAASLMRLLLENGGGILLYAVNMAEHLRCALITAGRILFHRAKDDLFNAGGKLRKILLGRLG